MIENNVVHSDLVSINNLSQTSLLSNAITNESTGLERQIKSVNSFFSSVTNPLNIFKTGKWPTVGKYMSKANALVGFAATIVGLFWLGQSTATAPKYTTDDIMRKLANEFPNLNYKIDSGFADVLNTLRSQHQEVMSLLNSGFSQIQIQLSQITAKLGDLEMSQYQGVELAISSAFNDIQFNSTSSLVPRALNLYDRLVYFLNGMLGQNAAGVDILKNTQEKFENVRLYLNVHNV